MPRKAFSLIELLIVIMIIGIVYSLVVGNPAQYIKDIREIKSKKNREKHYPWPYNFERGMPWEGIGYDTWLKSQ